MEIRKVFFNGEWWFAGLDIAKIITGKGDGYDYSKMLTALDKNFKEMLDEFRHSTKIGHG